ncbi:CHRD domain-containing protein [Streptomyces sp. ISL-98]|uniref:CHRD domain-containing protein n=1 Tax=Streptomyces sp. ISL-98 TaxID=2819192 RepID=UPI001BE97DE3|nr:CHRD domain-containing protein [Streptomyces sp. ISL-98]MBT2506428.1 CHRD domain-containing protein [Streptomyces sp. ISL-98]
MGGIAQRRKSIIIGTTAVAAAAGITLGVLPAFADDGSSKGTSGHGGHSAGSSADVAVQSGGSGSNSGASFFAASLNGANEVPVQGGPAVGDKDGVALEFVKLKGSTVSFAVKWRGTDKPTALHIHQGGKGVNGGIKVDFTGQLGKGKGTGKGRTATGSVQVKDTAVLNAFKADPTGFYANLHTAEFPGGAVRGQFHKVTNAFNFDHALNNFQAPVVKGKQIYECKKGTDGKRSFQQRDVRAVLAGHISHSFVKPNSGTPQWVARDHSAVTGSLISKSPNGDGNIPELDLQAKQSGKKHGLFAHTTEILRLNTVGGVAPAGSCKTGSIEAVPYQADYVFIQR